MERSKVRLNFFYELPIAFLIGLFFHFISTNAIAYFLGFNGFLFSTWFFSIFGIAFWIWKVVNRKQASNNQDKNPSLLKRGGLILLVTFVLVACEYLFSCWDQIQVASSIDGVLYQDIVYLIGVGHTILQSNQFPIPDLQIADSVLRYHILAYHFTAFFLDSISQNEFLIYVLSVKLAALFYMTWAFVACALAFYRNASLFWLVGLVFLTFNAEFLLSGINLTVFETYFSLSFCLQLALFAVLTYYVKLVFIERNQVDIGSVFIFLLLFAIAVLIKASSLILLPIWGLLFLFVKDKRWSRADSFKIGILLTLVASLVYLIFFWKDSGRGGLLNSLSNLNCTLCEGPLISKSHAVIAVLKEFHWDEVLIGLVSFVSFRLVLLYRRQNQFLLIALFVAAYFFSIIIKQDAFAFYLPIMVMLSFFAIAEIAFIKSKPVQIISILLLIGSLYPINSAGFYVQRKVGYKLSSFAVIDRNQYDFLKDMAAWVPSSSVVYTFNHFSDTLHTSDYFYPAALSARQFYLGGARFAVNGSIPQEALDTRIDTVKKIESAPSDQWMTKIRETGCSFIYIHRDHFTSKYFDQLKSIASPSSILMLDEENILIKL
jgi:hypothetical protein